MNSTVLLSKVTDMLPSAASVLSVSNFTFKEVVLPLVSVFAGASLAYRSQKKIDNKKAVEAELDVLVKLIITLLNQLDQVSGTCNTVYRSNFKDEKIKLTSIKIMTEYEFESSSLSFLFVKNIELYSKIDLRLKLYKYALTRVIIFNETIRQEPNTLNDMIALREVFNSGIDVIENHFAVISDVQSYISNKYSLKSINSFTPEADLDERLASCSKALGIIQDKINKIYELSK